MPIYEYRCTSCGHTVEIIQKLGDAAPASCESCSGPMEKLVSRTSFHLKGGGWYDSGYAKSNAATGGSSPDAAGSAASGSSESTKADSAKSESAKPETKKSGGCGSGCGCH